MKKLLFVVVMLLAPWSMSAQGVDIYVRIDVDPSQATLRAPYGVHVQWRSTEAPQDVVLIVDVPVATDDFNVWDSRMECTREGTRIRCTLPSVEAFDGGLYVVSRPEQSGTYAATATVTSTTPDPNPENNTSSASIDVLGLPLLRLGGVSIDMAEENAASPGRLASIRTGVQNDGETATNVVLRITLPEGGTFLGVDYYVGPEVTCDTTPGEVVCRWARIRNFELMQFRVDFLPPDRNDGGTFPLQFTVDAAEPDAEPAGRSVSTPVALRRRFIVSNTANDGPGSLRQAMLESSLQCATEPCLIDLRTTDPIRPTSPLPELAGFIKMDSVGARAEIDGSLLVDGHGITARVCELRMANLAVRNFPGHAIEVWPGGNCGYLRLGVFIKNTHLTRNLRGIVVKGNDSTIEANEIHFNRRAGIFIDSGSFMKVIGNNITGNGASGVFVNLSTQSPFYGVPPEARIHNNSIHHNGEWGVSRTSNGWVELLGNRISGNFLYGYDVGLDLSTPNRLDDRIGVPNKPILFSATFDPVSNQTIVRGRSDATASRLDVYASTSLSGAGYPEAEQSVASQFFRELGEFTVAIPGDLRGKWITATATKTVQMDWTVNPSDTSELSDAVRVE